MLAQLHQLRYWIGWTFFCSDAHAVCFSRCCRAGFKADNTMSVSFRKSSILTVASLRSLYCYWSHRDRVGSRSAPRFGLRHSLRPFLVFCFFAEQVLTQLDFLRCWKETRPARTKSISSRISSLRKLRNFASLCSFGSWRSSREFRGP